MKKINELRKRIKERKIIGKKVNENICGGRKCQWRKKSKEK